MCKHRPKSLWRARTVCLVCGQAVEANGPFWMNPGFHQWLFSAILMTLWGHHTLPWFDALHPFWAAFSLLVIADIPATVIMLIYRRYFSPYEVIEAPSTRKRYL